MVMILQHIEFISETQYNIIKLNHVQMGKPNLALLSFCQIF